MKILALFLLFGLVLVNAQTGSNPFQGVDYYINPDFVAEIETSITKHPDLKTILTRAENIAAAYWIDTIARIGNVTRVLDGALAQQQRTGRKTLATFVVYDVPNRDCAAAASNGEITCSDNACTAGINTYKTKYIDPIVAIWKKYPNLPIVAFIEPDSLANLATNMDLAKCQQAENAYITGISYTIQQIATLPNVVMYLDAAHGGWLGWDDNRQKIAQVFNNVLNKAGGANKIRGFVTNLANYQPLGTLSSSDDPCNLKSQYNQAINEVIYVNMLSQSLSNAGIRDKRFVIDTSRNGVTNMRKDCSNWCNINNSGFGRRPTADTSFTGLNIIDALFWVKTPGESDGTSDSGAPRYDFHCSSSDSKTPSPQAGQWFDEFFVMEAQNANPPL
jgi:cellulose 1,4-beta-cellobiosidase